MGFKFTNLTNQNLQTFTNSECARVLLVLCTCLSSTNNCVVSVFQQHPPPLVTPFIFSLQPFPRVPRFILLFRILSLFSADFLCLPHFVPTFRVLSPRSAFYPNFSRFIPMFPILSDPLIPFSRFNRTLF